MIWPILLVFATTVVGMQAVRGPWAVRVCWGGLLGMAAAGLGAYVGAFVGAPVAGGALAVLLLGWQGRRHPLDSPGMVSWQLGLVGAVAAALVVLVVWFPQPGWDATAMWTFRGRMIAGWGSHFHPSAVPGAGGHPYYPPWQPSLHALGFAFTNAGWVPGWQLAWLWAFGAGAAVSRAARTSSAAASLMLVVMVSPAVVRGVVTNYADMSLLVLLVCGVLLVEKEPAWAAPLLAAAAICKQEGMWLVVVVLLAYRLARHRVWPPALAVAAAIVPWVAFTWVRGLSSNLVDLGPLFHLPTLVSRTVEMGAAVWATDAVAAWGPALLVTVWMLMRTGTFGPAGWAGVIGLSALAATYVLSTNDVTWHVTFSVDRTLGAPIALLAVGTITPHWEQRHSSLHAG